MKFLQLPWLSRFSHPPPLPLLRLLLLLRQNWLKGASRLSFINENKLPLHYLLPRSRRSRTKYRPLANIFPFCHIGEQLSQIIIGEWAILRFFDGQLTQGIVSPPFALLFRELHAHLGRMMMMSSSKKGSSLLFQAWFDKI